MKNIYVRTISGIVFLAIMLTGMLLNDILYVMLMSFIAIVMTDEYVKISIKRQTPWKRVLADLISVAFVSISAAICHSGSHHELMLVPIVLLSIFPVSQLYAKEGYEDLPHYIYGIIYTSLPFALLNLVAFQNGVYTSALIVSMFAILWGSDVGAYVFGVAFGRFIDKKLFPSISPKKTWIGFVGGLITAMLIGFILQSTGYLQLDIAHAVILGLIINIFGVLGDLVESQLKRNFGIKDSGSIMPGHGGLLDRFDGALISFPIAVIYLLIFVL